MIYELRIYHAYPGRLPALNARFQNHTLKMWERFGIRHVGFWTTLIGDNSNDLYYILEWESLAEREQKWNAFIAHPDWLAIRAETERDGPLVTHISNVILSPTAYSKLK
ncbi:MAG TPA: NIPSNAP family protein [Burkholderiales bacterium]|nr:NIPSNAP family protein [Burkholderiales bacterium]